MLQKAFYERKGKRSEPALYVNALIVSATTKR